MNNIKERVIIILGVSLVTFILLAIVNLALSTDIELVPELAPKAETRGVSPKIFEYEVSILPSGDVQPDQVIQAPQGSKLTFTNSNKSPVLLTFDEVQFVIESGKHITISLDKKSELIYNIQISGKEPFFSGVRVR